MVSAGTMFGMKLSALCIVWYITSAANNIFGKLLLQSFAYPTTVTLFQFLSITLFSMPSIRYLSSVRHKPHISWSYYFKLIIPLAFGKFLASVSSHFSLWAVPVSYAHTVKASMPLFVVLLSRVILGEKQTTKVYLSLVPIILGVMIASVTELEFNAFGLLAALFSIFVFSLQNIYSKKVLKETSIHHLRLLYMLAKHALVMFIPFWVYHDLPDILYSEKSTTTDGWIIGSLLFLDGLCNFLQNVIAFTVLSMVTPLTYSVCNASKRIAVITCSILMLKNPVTWVNIFGMSLAIFGVFYYNKAKLDARNEPLLPTKAKTKKVVYEDYDDNKKGNTNLLLRFIDADHSNYGQSIVAPKSQAFYGDNVQHSATYGNGFVRGNNQLHHLKHSNADGKKSNGNSHYHGIDMINI